MLRRGQERAKSARASWWLVGLGVGLSLAACRAEEADCEALATHIAKLAEAEGKGGPGSALAIEGDCKQLRPTRKLVECMQAAQSLAEVEACGA
ncbi:hypothetical protein G6O69_31740 [Pseudenhygromyxa sp. WMMC2535]|uniref:hypothetical protein n=1 Tax=Pseudenhygromyxa sp. WMMC2535 TaxID=2712867 RepID=UPI001595C430|nr:hypothetical protein [Pseudenhygromyxa sp. WMMC2535]NVB42439.1 hypothetical protein [Pseudenhygromyxa sp. WMMC2535]